MVERCAPGLYLAGEKEGYGQMWRFCRLVDVRYQGTMLSVQHAAFFSKVQRAAGQSDQGVGYGVLQAVSSIWILSLAQTGGSWVCHISLTWNVCQSRDTATCLDICRPASKFEPCVPR